MAAGATIIRRLLVDYPRKRKAHNRGGAGGRGIPLQIPVVDNANQIDLLELNDALESLGRKNRRAFQVVELKFFGGLSADEIAEQLGVSVRTINNDWRYAKAELYRSLRPTSESRKRHE